MSNLGFRIFPPKRAPRGVVKLYADFSSPNISDNMNRINGACGEIRPMHGREKLLGSAFTVRTRPGDNLIVHKALDMLEPGDALVVDAEPSSFSRPCIGRISAHAPFMRFMLSLMFGDEKSE